MLKQHFTQKNTQTDEHGSPQYLEHSPPFLVGRPARVGRHPAWPSLPSTPRPRRWGALWPVKIGQPTRQVEIRARRTNKRQGNWHPLLHFFLFLCCGGGARQLASYSFVSCVFFFLFAVGKWKPNDAQQVVRLTWSQVKPASTDPRQNPQNCASI